jgi:hypothetical protein
MIALYVSSDIFAHYQELLNCIFTASVDTYVRHCLPVLWEKQNFRQLRTYRQKLKKYSLEAPDDERYRSSGTSKLYFYSFW